MGVGRVIARPFVGVPGAFTRTANRMTTRSSLSVRRCSTCSRSRRAVVAVGKTADLFAGRGIQRSLPTSSDESGVETLRR
jgi:phosphopentomutase